MGCSASRTVQDIIDARHLDGGGGPADYPRAATEFYAMGVPEFAIICWIAAGRPKIAESIYEQSNFYLADSRISPINPVWRMIIATRTSDESIYAAAAAEYGRCRQPAPPTWVLRALGSV
jgi:hypothetical protein